MRKLITYRVLAAYLLLVVLTVPVGMQSLHNFLEEHHPQIHCDGEHGQIHIHDQSYAFDHCFLCTFHFSQYHAQLKIAKQHIPGWNLRTPQVQVDALLPQHAYYQQNSRAPPSVL